MRRKLRKKKVLKEPRKSKVINDHSELPALEKHRNPTDVRPTSSFEVREPSAQMSGEMVSFIASCFAFSFSFSSMMSAQ